MDVKGTSERSNFFSSLSGQRDMIKKKIVLKKGIRQLTFSTHFLWILLVCCLFWILPGCIELDNELESNCFNWPEIEFSPINYAVFEPYVRLKPCDLAFDFTLKDPSGKEYTLSSLLATKPVLLVFGAFT